MTSTPSIAKSLTQYAFDVAAIGREFNYTPPIGGFVNNDITEFNAIVWNETDPAVIGLIPGYYNFYTPIPGQPIRGAIYVDGKYAGDNFPALQAQVTALAAASSPRAFSSPTRAVNTSYQPSSTRDALVSASATVAVALTLLVGGAGTVILESASDSGFTTSVAELGRTGLTGGAGIALNQSNGGQLSGIVPTGHYYRYRTVITTGTSTTVTFSLTGAREVLI